MLWSMAAQADVAVGARCPASPVAASTLIRSLDEAKPDLPVEFESARPYLRALESVEMEALSHLLWQRGDPDVCLPGASFLAYAAAIGTTAQVELLLKHGAHPDAPLDSNGATPLMTAIGAGRWRNAEALLDAGANAAQASDGGITALHEMALARCGKAVTCPDKERLAARLLGMKVSVDAVTTRGATPLMLAALSGDTALMKRLLARGADPTCRNGQGRTALDLAEQANQRAAAALLAR
ncbi:ankyrin repeat domain-containing protein [Chitiniphilus eburneus]|uniref:ankyrin repeat domain-containing protein n=1 Tax=Chitiniphilus eburneus TaxID=2571148 RepID=UPI0010AC7416|nr:ankyrin repeat domain-containing protein [Chitiniphilus eburneus]